MKSMNKSGLIIIFTLLIFAQFVAAETTNDEKVQQAYQCLRSEIGNKSSSALSLQEATFSILALGNVDKVKEKLDSEKSTSGNCWPKSSCKIKETAQALLASKALGRDTSAIETYLISKNTSATGLTWFIQIDIVRHNASSCTVAYDSTTRNIAIGEDMKLSGDTGSCLSISSSGYWLEIASSCLDKKYDISCDQEFVSNLLYTKSSSGTIYVSAETHGADGAGHTFEEIKSKCFKGSNNNCDYEGSLWAAAALQQTGHDVDPFIPYLVALAEDNSQYLPAAFLYKITNGQDQYSTLVQSQIQSKYWQAPSSPYGKFYDTALAMTVLSGSSAAEVDSAKNYLLNSGLQTSKGCWNNNNIRDTAFLLYAGWSDLAGFIPNNGNSGNGSSTIDACTTSIGFCGGRFACLDAGGVVSTNYACPLVGDVCCSKNIALKTCSEQNGKVCSTGTQCTDSEVPSSDGSCCLGTCEKQSDSVNVCEQAGNTCRSSCDSSLEEQISDQCLDSSQVCCQALPTSGTENNSSSSWLWIVLLVVLIILVVLAIVFRNRIQIWLAKFKKGKASSAPIITRRPPFPPMPPAYSRPQMSATRRPASNVDKEMEETMRKLKEMSK